MVWQLSVAVRNAQADAFESTVGVSAVVEVRTGAQPANCAAADSGSLLASITVPADWLAAASNGAKTMLGTWADNSADGTGTAGHFRVKSSGGTCHGQGSVTATGGGGDMTVANTSFAATQPFSITSFTYTRGNA